MLRIGIPLNVGNNTSELLEEEKDHAELRI
jgi:hypothetical protein